MRPEAAGGEVDVEIGEHPGDIHRPVFGPGRVDCAMFQELLHLRGSRGAQHIAGVDVRVGQFFDHGVFRRCVFRIAES